MRTQNSILGKSTILLPVLFSSSLLLIFNYLLFIFLSPKLSKISAIPFPHSRSWRHKPPPGVHKRKSVGHAEERILRQKWDYRSYGPESRDCQSCFSDTGELVSGLEPTGSINSYWINTHRLGINCDQQFHFLGKLIINNLNSQIEIFILTNTKPNRNMQKYLGEKWSRKQPEKDWDQNRTCSLIQTRVSAPACRKRWLRPVVPNQLHRGVSASSAVSRRPLLGSCGQTS